MDERKERHRKPSPSSPLPRPQSNDEVIDRLQALETRVLVYEERITGKLEEIEENLRELHVVLSDLKPKRMALLPWIAIAITIGGIVFRAGNYPDRSEVEAMRNDMRGQIERVAGDLKSVEKETIRISTILERKP